MQREEKYEQIDKMAERYLADRSDREDSFPARCRIGV